MKRRLLALALVLCLVLSLFGCTQDPAPTTQPTTETTETTVPEPTAPEALSAYGDARSALEAAKEAAFDIVLTTEMTVADQVFTSRSIQTLTYTALDTDAPQIRMEENIIYDFLNADEAGTDEEEDPTVDYIEIYSDGTLYVSYEDESFFSGALTQEAAAARYLPPVLLDEALYETVTSSLDGDNVIITFRSPTAGESWAVPEGAQLLSANGEATISPSGALQHMYYFVTYAYGGVEMTLAVESALRADIDPVTVPEDPDAYTTLQYVDALRSFVHGISLMDQSGSATITSMESIVSNAAAVVRNQAVTLSRYGKDTDFSAKVDTNVYLMDYSTYEDQTYEMEETYRNGKYVYTENDGVPTTVSALTLEDMEAYCQTLQYVGTFTPDYWADAAVTDLGALWLIEFTYTDELGDELQSSVCSTLFQNPATLNSLASAYVTNEVTGYLALEKLTGLPTAAGYYYEGTHTIEGGEYLLSCQMDQSFAAASFGAYEEITDEKPVEQEPEEKATPLFYHVTGENGQEMWLLGTIHVGDSRTGFLPQEIYDAFAASDALAMEVDSEAFEEAMDADKELQEKISGNCYYSDGTTVADHMDEELYETALKYMKATGNNTMNTPYMKLAVWSNAIENAFANLGHNLTSEQGVEERLTALAKEQDKEIREVEDTEEHMELLYGWSDELQLLMMEEMLEVDPFAYWLGVNELYEMWCTGDEAALQEELSGEVDTSEMTEEELAEYNEQLPLMEEYNKAMSYDRNEKMLEVAIDYLESGDVVFYAVGLAHVLDNVNGLLQALRDAGYTVEAVTYA